MIFISRLLLSRMEMIQERIIDEYGIHQLVYGLFPSGANRDFLYYVDYGDHLGGVSIVIQSHSVPEHCRIGRIQTKEIPDAFFQCESYYFQMRINPVVKKDGHLLRIENRSSEAIEWLCRRADTMGVVFSIDSMDKKAGGVLRMRRKADARSISISYVDIVGCLRVIDRDRFLTVVNNGFGAHKGFGFGLLQLWPLKEEK